jgi:hypothetical protein
VLEVDTTVAVSVGNLAQLQAKPAIAAGRCTPSVNIGAWLSAHSAEVLHRFSPAPRGRQCRRADLNDRQLITEDNMPRKPTKKKVSIVLH